MRVTIKGRVCVASTNVEVVHGEFTSDHIFNDLHRHNVLENERGVPSSSGCDMSPEITDGQDNNAEEPGAIK